MLPVLNRLEKYENAGGEILFRQTVMTGGNNDSASHYLAGMDQ